MEKDLIPLVALEKGPVVPLIPSQTIKYELTQKYHCCWGLSNINFLAPILIDMWRAWLNLLANKVTTFKGHAIHATNIFKEGVDILDLFLLSAFDHKKYSTPSVQIRTK